MLVSALNNKIIIMDKGKRELKEKNEKNMK